MMIHRFLLLLQRLVMEEHAQSRPRQLVFSPEWWDMAPLPESLFVPAVPYILLSGMKI